MGLLDRHDWIGNTVAPQPGPQKLSQFYIKDCRVFFSDEDDNLLIGRQGFLYRGNYMINRR